MCCRSKIIYQLTLKRTLTHLHGIELPENGRGIRICSFVRPPPSNVYIHSVANLMDRIFSNRMHEYFLNSCAVPYIDVRVYVLVLFRSHSPAASYLSRLLWTHAVKMQAKTEMEREREIWYGNVAAVNWNWSLLWWIFGSDKTILLPKMIRSTVITSI